MSTLEQTLFGRIKSSSPDNWKEETSKILGLSISSLYKKAKGQTALTFEEAKMLADAYNISIDEICGLSHGAIPFQAPRISSPIESVYGYLQQLAGELGGIDMNNGDARVLYATSEIPVFHYMHSPLLGAFKISVWAKSVWGIETEASLQDLIQKLFADNKYNALCRGILSGYCSIPSVEL